MKNELIVATDVQIIHTFWAGRFFWVFAFVNEKPVLLKGGFR